MKRALITVLFLFLVILLQGQDEFTGKAKLDKFLASENYAAAIQELTSQTKQLVTSENYDSLAGYAYYVGKVNELNSSKQVAIDEILQFETYFKEQTANNFHRSTLHSSIANFYESIGNNEQSKQHHISALEFAKQIQPENKLALAKCYYNLSSVYQAEGDFVKTIDYSRISLAYYNKAKGVTSENLYFANLGMGVAMYYSSKIDSAAYYWSVAEHEIKKDTSSSINRYYRPGLLANNLSAIYMMQGKTTAALKAMERAIDYNELFIASDAEDFKRNDAKIAHNQYIENLGGIYLELGDFEKNLKLLEYAHLQKKEMYDDKSPELFKSYSLLANAALNNLQFDLAKIYSEKAIELLQEHKGLYRDWNSSAWLTKALVLREQDNTNEANNCIEKVLNFIHTDGKTEYSNEDFTQLRSISEYYRLTNQHQEALATALNSYQLIQATQSETSILKAKQEEEISNIYFFTNEYQQASNFANKSLASYQYLQTSASTYLDSLTIDVQKTLPILLQLKSRYELKQNRDEAFLKSILDDLQLPFEILEKQKVYLQSFENIELLIHRSKELFEFAKEVNLELFQLTNDEHYLLNLLSYHENSIYNRIRSRLSIYQRDLELDHEQLVTEQAVNADLTKTITSDETENQWRQFLQSLEQKYPEYARSNYSSEGIQQIQSHLPQNNTVVRYFFLENQLHVITISNQSVQYFPLQFTRDKQLIETVNQSYFDAKAISPMLEELYDQLWRPIEDELTTERVIIIPDEELFNLSFDMLISSPIKKFEEFSEYGLIAKHMISYHYSSLLLQQPESNSNFAANFVAFAPGFSNQLKKQGEQKADSLEVDDSYFTLLPQPFIVKLVKKYSKKLNGKLFLNEQASKQKFLEHAGKNKIIHIGTHAISNNVSPELSRLIFSQNKGSDPENSSHYLYTYELYQHDLSSDLAILSACETGKPTYQPGEGMISLANAFNYAGSRSILTSLWKIDEQTSSELIDEFYQNLRKGQSKDEALRNAKLTYIQQAKGRLKAPEYWAGLIILGDYSPLKLTKPIPWALIISVALLLLFTLLIFSRNKNRKRKWGNML